MAQISPMNCVRGYWSIHWGPPGETPVKRCRSAGLTRDIKVNGNLLWIKHFRSTHPGHHIPLLAIGFGTAKPHCIHHYRYRARNQPLSQCSVPTFLSPSSACAYSLSASPTKLNFRSTKQAFACRGGTLQHYFGVLALPTRNRFY